MTHEATHASIAQAREEFLAMVAHLRPELHRYCARITGSAIEGEDIVQDTLAKAFYSFSLHPELPPLRPWLFRVAHNAALDHLKSHGRRLTDPHEDMVDVVGVDERPDPYAVRAALAQFLVLPVIQRSAVILKDVLGHSLEETAEIMDISVLAVKAALVRGRANLKAGAPTKTSDRAIDRAELDRYAALFNARDWDRLRALIGEDCRLDLVSKAQRRGPQVAMYFGRYAKENVTLRVAEVDGQLGLAAHVDGSASPAYFIFLRWESGRVSAIRDFRYIDYIAAEAEVVALGSSNSASSSNDRP
jgi:RNA polymerase sigma factor (sigma-70 family)